MAVQRAGRRRQPVGDVLELRHAVDDPVQLQPVRVDLTEHHVADGDAVRDDEQAVGVLDGEPGACPDSVIKVTALTDATTYPAGKDPRLTVEVSNIGTTSCKRDLGQVALELIVSSGSARTWSSDDCNPGGSHAVVTLRAGQTFATTVVWSRTTSAPGCPSGKPQAAPGHYQLVARNLTLTSAPAPFQLT